MALGLVGMGNQQNAAIGAAAGAAIGSIFPGIGTMIGSVVGGLVGGMFGPSAHYTPSGMLYDQAATLLKTQAVQLADTYNEFAASRGLPPQPVPNLSMTSEDDPWTGPYLAKILGNPAYASATSPDPLENLQKTGVYDAAIKVQNAIMQTLEQEMMQPGSSPAPSQSYAASQGQPETPAPTSYAAVAGAPLPTTPAPYAPGVSLAGAGLLAALMMFL
jgi:Glycine zipper